MLHDDGTNPAAVSWVLARALVQDLSRLARELEKGRAAGAAGVIRGSKSLFEAASNPEAWLGLLAQAEAASGKASNGDAPSSVLLRCHLTRAARKVGRRGGEDAMAALADRALSAGEVAAGLECLGRLADRDRWDLVVTVPRMALESEAATASGATLAD